MKRSSVMVVTLTKGRKQRESDIVSMVTWEASQEATAPHSIVPPRGLTPLPAHLVLDYCWEQGDLGTCAVKSGGIREVSACQSTGNNGLARRWTHQKHTISWKANGLV